MASVRKACVVLTRKSDGSFEVMDAHGNVLQASSSPELGIACAQVLANDELPEVTTPSALQLTLEKFVADATGAFLAKAQTRTEKALAPLVGPLVLGAAQGATKLKEQRRQEANTRQHQRDQESHRHLRDLRRRLLQDRSRA